MQLSKSSKKADCTPDSFFDWHTIAFDNIRTGIARFLSLYCSGIPWKVEHRLRAAYRVYPYFYPEAGMLRLPGADSIGIVFPRM